MSRSCGEQGLGVPVSHSVLCFDLLGLRREPGTAVSSESMINHFANTGRD